jgi:dGTPase
MLTQRQIKKFESLYLAAYAMKSFQSRGRMHKETEHPYRSSYQRDRDRIIHSAAFRRLEYKTQVFVNHEGDYYRTRLTHTLEVSQIARTIASALRLNTDLTEAVALAHDLGHTPFGHAGEEALDELMISAGGFNHNLQGLRVVELLEEKYPEFPGLNLTWEVREGIIKHSSAFDRAVDAQEFLPAELATLEAQVVDIADEIAYDNHDLDDGLTSGLLSETDLRKLPIWRFASSQINKRHSSLDAEMRKYVVIKSLIDLQVTDLIRQTRRNIARLRLDSWQKAKRSPSKVVSFSAQMLRLRQPLRMLLLNNLYRHYRVIRMSNKAKHFIQQLFEIYVARPEAMPANIQRRILRDGKERAVCDYIAGMTDRYALDEYKKLFDPYEKV